MRKAYALFIQAMVDGRMTEEEIGNLEEAIVEVRILLAEVIADKEESVDDSTKEVISPGDQEAQRRVGSRRKRGLRIGGGTD